MPAFEYGDFATWTATAVAVASAFLSYRALKKAEKQQEQATRQASLSTTLTEKQHQLQLREWTDQYFTSVRSWGEDMSLAISEAAHIIEHPELNSDHKRPILIKLSALIDTGRWYFPNQWVDDYGTDKEPAYRGVRQQVLNCAVAVYEILDQLESIPFDHAKHELLIARREFISIIQQVLDPRKREQEIKKILLEFEVSDRLRNAP